MENDPFGPEESITEQAQGPAHALVRRFRLDVIAGPDAGRSHVSVGERVVVGSHESAGLILTDRQVSRFHCDLTLEKGQVVLQDLGSRNGTSLDHVRIGQAFVANDAVITVGGTRIRFSLADDHVQIPLFTRERFGNLVGRSRAMRAALAVLEAAAGSDATVLIEGETGTGKEVAAESLHLMGARKKGPLIVVDCGAIPPSLLESELFGHERGAFTGAVGARAGAFEAASGGTLFLDEIGELAADMQPRLLRALERREVKRVGADHHRPVDVRVIAATNRDLRSDINDGRFRSDLYYRLAVVQVRLPPLRERLEDLPLLAHEIARALEARGHGPATTLLGPALFAELARHAWPGNVRELRNYLERCLVLRDQAPPPAHATGEPTSTTAATEKPGPLRAARDAFERDYLVKLLATHDNNISAAARTAGMERAHLYRFLWKHGLR